jgi:DNA-binding MarR family transcriptional regulator
VSAPTTDVEVQEAAGRVYLAVGRLFRSLRRAGSPGMGHGMVSALATLVACGPMRLGDLAARESVAPPTLSRIVAALVDAGYATREPDPVDGRAWLASATPEGERVVSGVRSTRIQELQRRMARLTDEQRAALIAALPALEELLAAEES